jgi:hypothetical protein
MAQEPRGKLPTASETYSQQAERLAHQPEDVGSRVAVFVTTRDPVIITEGGGRIPAVPPSNTERLDQLKDENDGIGSTKRLTALEDTREYEKEKLRSPESLGGPLPPSQTNPLFPPLPLYGPPTLLRNIKCISFRVSSFFLSLSFLVVLILGAAITSIPLVFIYIRLRLRGNDPNERRPFYREEQRRSKARQAEARAWKRKIQESSTDAGRNAPVDIEAASNGSFEPREGGKDKLICDIGYYARRVGLDVEEFKVETEDGFLIVLWHVYDPKEYSPASSETRGATNPKTFPQTVADLQLPVAGESTSDRRGRKYPVLLIHGLLQSAGAYCTNDDDSLAFFLCKRLA